MATSSVPTPGVDGARVPELPADAALQDVLQQVWGFAGFRPLQREAMHAILTGRDSVVVLPTGGGKSLCFQAPALVMPGPADAGRRRDQAAREGDGDEAGTRDDERDRGGRRRGLAVVVSPLISLMKDQVDGLRVDGVAAAYLNSTLGARERDEVLDAIKNDQCRLLYVSPERLVADGSLRRLLVQSGVRFVAIDEAHCISQWGHDFRPEYRQIGALRGEFPGVSFHAFTATATERVRRDIVSELRLDDPAVLVGSFDRPNLTYRVLRRAHLHTQLTDILARHAGEAGIVYCSSRREVEELAAWLVEQGVKALPYHAGLDDGVRSRHQEAFLDEDVDIVVATVAFGMGIDRSNVRFVVHAGSPRSLEHYQQESGRAGRDGLAAECVLIFSGGDFVRWRQMLEANGEFTDSARALLREMERYAIATRCRHHALLEYFGQRAAVESCGACDWCLKELTAVPDATVVARKILSCVARVKQAYGVGHVTDVLAGRATEKVAACGHDRLSTFALLKEESTAAIRGYLEQLIAAGLLDREGDPYPVLRLTAAGTSVLKGHDDCVLYRAVEPNRRRKRSGLGGRELVGGHVNPELFDRLRDVRLRIARARGVPPYVIFHDTTLRDMAQRRPRTIEDLHAVYGVGAKKAADFGDAFLDAIRTHGHPH